VKDISLSLNSQRQTVEILKSLTIIKSNILIKTRKVGKSDYFKLNIKNPFIKHLIKLDWSLVKNGELSKTCEIVAG